MAGKIRNKIKTSAKENTVGVISAVVILLVILLVGVISLRIASSNRTPGTSQSPEEKETSYDLVANAGNNSVTAYIEKGITADERHYSISMTINKDSRTIRVLKGYQNIEDRNEGLPNNLEAYQAFLKALSRNNFTESREDDSEFGWREACPTQKGYRFKLHDDNNSANEDFDRWYTFCDGTRFGDYGGRVNSTFALFRNQFPNYSQVTRGISL